MDMIRTLMYYTLVAFSFILLARVLLSWFPNIDRNNTIVQLIYNITEPILRPVRNFLPQTGGVDFSPLIVFLILSVLIRLVL